MTDEVAARLFLQRLDDRWKNRETTSNGNTLSGDNGSKPAGSHAGQRTRRAPNLRRCRLTSNASGERGARRRSAPALNRPAIASGLH